MTPEELERKLAIAFYLLDNGLYGGDKKALRVHMLDQNGSFRKVQLQDSNSLFIEVEEDVGEEVEEDVGEDVEEDVGEDVEWVFVVGNSQAEPVQCRSSLISRISRLLRR